MKSKLKYRLNKKLLRKYSNDKIRYVYDFVFFGIGFFISSFIALIISILVNKGLSKEDLGLFNYNKTVLEFLSYIFTLVMYRSYLRFNISGVNLSLLDKVKKINYLAFVLLCGAIYYLTKSLIPLFFAFFVFFEERLYFFRSLMLIKKVNILKIGVSLLTLLLICLFTYLDKLEPDNILFSYGIGFFLALFFFKSKNYKVNNEIINWKMILLYTFPVIGSIIVKSSLDIVSQYLIKNNFESLELSKYAIATRVLLSVKVFSSLFMMFFPAIYFREIKKKNGRFIKKLRFFVFILMLTVSSIAILFRKMIYELMGAAKYIEYVDLYSILVLSELVFVVGALYGTYLAYALKTHYTLIIYSVGALLNIVLLNVYLKSNGIHIAPYSILMSNIVMTSLFIIFAYKYEKKYVNQPIS